MMSWKMVSKEVESFRAPSHKWACVKLQKLSTPRRSLSIWVLAIHDDEHMHGCYNGIKTYWDVLGILRQMYQISIPLRPEPE